jgi:hypothetical protein
MLGRDRRVASDVEAAGTKIIKERKYKGYPPNPRLQSSEKVFLIKDGGAICDWFLELISGRSFAMP